MELVTNKDFTSRDVEKMIKERQSEKEEIIKKISNTNDLLRELRCKCFSLDILIKHIEEKYKEMSGKPFCSVKF